MNYLLDTHIFLWHIDGDDRLKNEIISIIENPSNNIFLRVGSLWEIAIKVSVGKLKIEHSLENLSQYIQSKNYSVLPISFQHLITVQNLQYSISH